MTAILHPVPASSAYIVPPTQNTAPVHEFRCLYTHDIRRKAKRWQDGFFRFHTFNKRVMVYDVQRNFIGDMHWQDGSEDPQDGDEVSLDRSGALVQVGEQCGTVEQDLSGLLAKRVAKPIEKGPDRSGVREAVQLQARPSNILPHTPAPRVGRASIPQKSPFETRRTPAGEEDWEQGPATKRHRRDDNHIPLWEILKTSKPPRAGPVSAVTAPSRLGPSITKPKTFSVLAKHTAGKGRPIGQSRLKVKETIDLTSSIEQRVQDEDDPRPLESPIGPALTTPVIAARPLPVVSTDRRSPKAPERSSLVPTTNNLQRVKEREQSAIQAARSSKDTIRLPRRRTPSPKRKEVLNLSTMSPSTTYTLQKSPKEKRIPASSRRLPVSPTMAPPPPPQGPATSNRSPSPAVSTTSHLPNPIEEPTVIPLSTASTAVQSEPKRAMKTLRLSSRGPKKTLLCQALIPPNTPEIALNQEEVNSVLAEREERQSTRSPKERSTPLSKRKEHAPPPQSKIPDPEKQLSPHSPKSSFREARSARTLTSRRLRKAGRMPFDDSSDSDAAFESVVRLVETSERVRSRTLENQPFDDDSDPADAFETPPDTTKSVKLGLKNTNADARQTEGVSEHIESIVVPIDQVSAPLETNIDAQTNESLKLPILEAPAKPVISAMRALLSKMSVDNPIGGFRPPKKQQDMTESDKMGTRTPPNNEDFDAQLVVKSVVAAALPPAKVKSLNEDVPAKPMSKPIEDTTTSAPMPPKPPNPHFKAPSISKPPPLPVKRSLIRHQSINSPNTDTTSTDGPPHARRTAHGLQRAEMLPNATTASRSHLPPPEDVSELIAATDREGDAGLGPWSREAWDLFGWEPPGRTAGEVVV